MIIGIMYTETDCLHSVVFTVILLDNNAANIYHAFSVFAHLVNRVIRPTAFRRKYIEIKQSILSTHNTPPVYQFISSIFLFLN